ncbi:MAG: flagellar biosynthetic protein FliQ [bacterium]
MDLLFEQLAKGFVATLIISMPVVLVAAGIGLVVGILQAVTQVQEQTIAAAPKILAVFLVIVMMGRLFTQILSEYLEDSIHLALQVIPKQGDYALAPEPPGKTRPFYEDEKDFRFIKRPDVDTMMKHPGKVPYSDKKLKESYGKANVGPSVGANMAEARRIYSQR